MGVHAELSTSTSKQRRRSAGDVREHGSLAVMPIEHKPVLATELVEMLAPQPGQIAVDCTFGAGGHARRVASLLGLDGTLICIDRDPVAAERFERFADEVTCGTRFLGADFAEGLRTLHGEGVHPDMIYMDL